MMARRRGMGTKAKTRIYELFQADPHCPRCEREMSLQSHGSDRALLYHTDALICHGCVNRLRRVYDEVIAEPKPTPPQTPPLDFPPLRVYRLFRDAA